jgi:hypothetical protein
MGEYRERVTGQAQDFVHGDFTGTVHAPVQSGLRWIVAVEDVLGERVEKVFSSKSRALDFYTELWLGMSRTEAEQRANPDLPQRQTEVQGARGNLQWHEAVAPTVQATHQAKTKKREGLNLRKVAEVLSSYGLDPIETIAEALVPVAVVDSTTGVTYEEHRLSLEERARIALELVQYVHPKLKAVEMKIDGTLAGMSQEQLDNRLQLLLARAAQQAAKGDA